MKILYYKIKIAWYCALIKWYDTCFTLDKMASEYDMKRILKLCDKKDLAFEKIEVLSNGKEKN